MRILPFLLIIPFLSSAQLNPVFVSAGPLSYVKVQNSNEGMFGFEENGKIGYLDKKGKVVIPAIYSYDTSHNSGYIPGFYNGYVKVVKDRKNGLADKTGKIIIPIEHESITPYIKEGNFVMVTKTIAGKKNYGVLSIQNKQIIPTEYESIVIYTGVIVLKQGGKWGLFDANGKQLLPFEYNNLTYYTTDKVLIAEKGTQYGVIDLTGKWLFEKSKSVFTLFGVHYGMVSCRVSDKYGFLDLKGNEVIVTKYDYSGYFESTGLARVSKKKPGSTYTNIYGFVDKKGTEVIPIQFETAGSFANGLVNLKDPETNRYGYMDKTGKWVLKPIYLEALSFDDAGGAWVKMTDGKYHYIDKAGKDLGMLNEAGGYKEFNKDGYIVYEDVTYPYIAIDKNGKQGKTIDDIETYYLSYETMTPYKSKVNSKYGGLDIDGNKVIPNDYDGFGGFFDGVCMVQKKIDGKLKSGYIDTKNNILVPLLYTSATAFRDGWGVVKKDSFYFFVDKSGNLKEPPRKYDNLSEFRSGYALGTVKGQNNAPSTYYYINKQLKEEFSVSYKEAYSFWDEVAVVKSDKEYELMNKKGEVFKSLGKVDYLRFSMEGMLAIRENKKWGFINNRGDQIVPPRYDSCESFSNGYAKVMKNKKWGIIDKAGNEIFETKYDNIASGENGIFIYYDKSWGVMDKTGKILVAPKYYSINAFQKDRTIARLGKAIMILKSPLAK